MGPNWIGAAANRANVHLRFGQRNAPLGQDLDEFPYASTAQGGPTAFGKYVPLGENRSEGAMLRIFYRVVFKGLGGPFAVVFIP
jgi:hypothetical protein